MRRNKGLLLVAIALVIGGLLVFYFSYYYGKEGEKQATVENADMGREKRAQEEQAVSGQEDGKRAYGVFHIS